MARAVGRRRAAAVLVMVGLVPMTGCAVVESPRASAQPPRALPAPAEHLPADAEVAEGSEWVAAADRLPDGVDRGARYASSLAATIALSEPFGRRPMPPDAPGITGEGLLGASGEEWFLVTVPTFDDPKQWGEQYLLVLGEDVRGWGLHEAFSRRLCVAAADGAGCLDLR
jgi:hypothetical protein